MKMKNWMRNAGFTLVELIVVIAVLGILGAGAAVGYSGYVKKANKAADQQMVAEIVYALELAAISDPSSVPGDATLFLDTTGAQVTGSDSAGMSAALENAYGSNFGSQLKLQYGQWGLGSTVTAQAQKLVANANYEGGLSYTDDVDKLWGEVETILTGLESKETINELYKGSAGLMADAGAYTVTNGTNMNDFAKLWCDFTGGESFSGFGKTYVPATEGTTHSKDLLNSMLAKSAAIKARNYAFGNWIINNYPNDADMIAAAEEIQKSGNPDPTKVKAPVDFTDLLKNAGTNQTLKKCNQKLSEAVEKYFGASTDYSEQIDGFAITGAAANPTATQAYRDAMGYYTLMSAVNEAASETSGMDNDTYKKTMAAAVHNTGVLLNDPTMLARIQGGCVAITVRDGSIWVTPQEIYIGGSDVGDGVGKSTVKLNDTVTVTVDLVDDDMKCSPDGSFVLQKNETGTIKIKISETLANALESESAADDIISGITAALSADWESQNESVATVINGTTVRGVSVGSCVISHNGQYSVDIPVKVVDGK